MKTKSKIFLFGLMAILLASCEDIITREVTYLANVPIYMSRADFNAAVKKSDEVEVKKPGKIYFKDNYLFLNELEKGVHVYNDADPTNPVYVCFINIPGNVDIAIKGDILYADSYIDLIAINISDPANPILIDRVENAFPNIYPMFDNYNPTVGIETSKGVCVGWKEEVITVAENAFNFGRELFYKAEMDMAPNTTGGGGTGVGGSLARFTIKENSLFAINNGYELKIFDIGSEKIKKLDSLSVSWNIETLFINNNQLFIGSTNGMFIYDITNTRKPVYVASFSHAKSCDPVVVEGDYAYITLRTGETRCFNGVNELQVVSIKDIYNPKLITTYPMHNPWGLGIDNGILFICDGDAGLKIYDASDVTKISDNMLKHFPEIKTYDVIPYNNLLIMSAEDGIIQYSYSDINNITELSRIAIK